MFATPPLLRSTLSLLAALAAGSALRAAPALDAAPEPAAGVLAAGETGRIHISLTPAPDSAAKLSVILRRDGRTELSRSEPRTGADGRASLDVSLPEPGAVLALLETTAPDGQKLSARGGLLFSPEKIKPAVPRPADFDAFWDAKLAALARVPIDAVLTPGKFAAPVPPGVAYTQFSLAVSATERVRGQLAYPDQPGKKFPALVIYQWAGVYPLTPGTVTGNAAKGWLAVNVFAHDLPIDEPAAYYDALKAGELKDYGAIGCDDREKSYFLRMFLGVRRALDFVRSHPAWDGRVLVAHGTSQGGTQSLVAAALDPAVTAVVANVPALCDQNGPEAGRAMPYPYWLAKTEGRDPAAVASAARYFDVAHFAPRIRVPVLVSAGLIDETCPPAGVAAMANALSGPREVLFMPQANHKGTNNTHAPYDARAKVWLEALRQGRPAPLP